MPVKITTAITTTTTKIPSINSVSSSIVNSSVVQSQLNSATDLKESSVNYRKIDQVMVEDTIEYTCFKMDYKCKISIFYLFEK